MINLGKVFILGDSYSTFENYIPDGYACFYTADREDIDVHHADETWWKQLIDSTGSQLVLNCSWSGTTICNTGYDKVDYSEISFIGRLDKLIESGYFKENQVDTIFVFGGTNDSWADSPLGEMMFSDWKKEDLFSILPAFCYLLHRIKTNLPDVRVISIINTELKPAVADGLKEICGRFGVDCVALENISKQIGHADKAGMLQIKEQILEYLKTAVK